MSFKIAFIGAGSLVFARTLFTDIISVPEFTISKLPSPTLTRTIWKRQENYVREIWTQTIFQSKLKQQPIVVTPSKMHVILLTVCVSVDLKDLKQM